jgi:hypothetical protein
MPGFLFSQGSLVRHIAACKIVQHPYFYRYMPGGGRKKRATVATESPPGLIAHNFENCDPVRRRWVPSWVTLFG